MHANNFVICDAEQEFAENFLRAVKDKKELNAQLHLFQELEQVQEFAEERGIQILLLGEEYPWEDRIRIPAEKRFVFVKEKDTELPEGEGAVYKYQSADQILIQIMGKAVKERIVSGELSRNGGRLIGIYSPVHRIGKTKFAIKLGKELAQKGPALYLNLEDYSGDECYFPDSQAQSLEDLLYYVRQEKGNLGLRISMMTGQLEELDYIRPMPVLQDLRAVGPGEWINLFEQILEHCIYESVILDLGDNVDGLYEILQECSTVYTLYIEERAAKAKLAQYTENLRRTGYESVLEHTVQKVVRARRAEEKE